MKTTKNRKKGFTLIEFLIYSVIVTIIIGSLVSIGINIIRGRSKVSVVEEINHNGRIIMEKITSTIRQSEDINSPTTGTVASILSLQSTAEENNPVIFSVDENGRLLQKMGGEEPFVITSEKTRIAELNFTNVSYPDSLSTIKIELKIEYYNPSGREEYNLEKSFFTTENIRRADYIEGKSSQSAPPPPTIASQTDDSVILNTISNGEYRKNNGPYQDSEVFENLLPGENFFTQRYKRSEDQYASPSSEAIFVLIEKEHQSAPSAPTLESKTENSIILTEIINGEYRIDGGEPQDFSTFEELSSGEEYSFSQRYKETETHSASSWSSESIFETEKNIYDFGTYYAYGDGTYAVNAKEYKDHDSNCVNGVYRIKPEGATSAFDVYADMDTYGGGWVLIDNEAGSKITSRTNGACTNISQTKGSILSQYTWSDDPLLMVKSSQKTGSLGWIVLRALTDSAKNYPINNNPIPTSGQDGHWEIVELNGNTNQGTASWIYTASGRIGTIWIGNGSNCTSCVSYCGSNSGLGNYTTSNTTSSTWVR